MARTPDPDAVLYRYTGSGHRNGVPRRDLTARDAARLGPAVIRDVTGGEKPMYVKAGAKSEAADKPTAADKE